MLNTFYLRFQTELDNSTLSFCKFRHSDFKANNARSGLKLFSSRSNGRIVKQVRLVSLGGIKYVNIKFINCKSIEKFHTDVFLVREDKGLRIEDEVALL